MADAVVVPGRMFGPAAGLLMYAGAVAERRAATVHRHSWSQEPPNPFDPEIEGWVRGEVTPLLDVVSASPPLIAKSLDTNAAVFAAERSLPAVWLTPVLTVPWIAAALGRATAPFLLVGGTADAMWTVPWPAACRRMCWRSKAPIMACVYPAHSPTPSPCWAGWSSRWRSSST